jgi:DNA-directed RNA polymerase subunit RPC12/RpoP
MSEFKYACPVCGQHIKCDSSQAGTTMECPTCFQKIIVPQAPATADPKFILTGTKVGERPVPKIPENNLVLPEKSFPVAVVILLVFVCMAAALLLVFHGKVSSIVNKETHPDAPKTTGAVTTTSNKTAQTSRTNAAPSHAFGWLPGLDGVRLPNSRASGQIQGQDFVLEHAQFQDGTLTLREKGRGPLDFGMQIDFNGATPEALSGQKIDVNTNTTAAATVTIYWLDNGQAQQEKYQGGYAMRLDFAQVVTNRLRGKIYFCAPDQMKSYIAGSFTAVIRKPKPND